MFGGSNDWLQVHERYVQGWMNKETVDPNDGAASREREYHEYLIYLHKATRVHVKPPLSTIPTNEQDNDEEDLYDVITRRGVQPERAPVENYVVSNPLATSLTSFYYLQERFDIFTLIGHSTSSLIQ
jgi:hypothetical protein